MRFVRLVETSQAVGGTRSRREKIEMLAACLANFAPDEVAVGVRMLSGELRQGKLGVGYATVQALRVEPASEASLELLDVDAALETLAGIAGSGSKKRREACLGALFARATADEQQFLRRLMVGELRQGALEGVMLDAVARAYAVPAPAVRRAVMLQGDAAEVAAAVRREGAAVLDRYRIELMRPLSPMLAQSAEGVEEVLAGGGGDFVFEHKLDGARVQVHREGDEVRVFTRKLHEVTARVPELVEAALALPVRSLVLDGEALALREDGRPLPFQVSMRRFGRTQEVERMRETLPLSTFHFDCLHLDGEDLIDRTAEARFEALAATVPESQRVPRLRTADQEEARAFLEGALGAGHEGVMAKHPEGVYEAGRRGAGWVKVKPVHTLDLVVLAVEWGSGRREGTLSNLHLGARDPAHGGFAMVGKTFKGMTDAMLRWQTERFLGLEIGREGQVVHVRPEQVVEIAFDGAQRSPHYPGGVALRFARVKRYREDKRAAEADSLEHVRAHLRDADPG